MNHLDVVRLLGLDAPTPPEDGYGRVVPEDSEFLAQAVPAGVFTGSVLLERPGVLPVRSLEEFTRLTSLRIEDMELSLRSRRQRLWLPFHPEPGGMVPWGRTATDGVLLWDTTAASTADWTTVVTDDDFQLWLDLPFSASEFVARALLGRAEGIPAFETIEEYESGSFWRVADEMRATATVLSARNVGAVEELVARIRNIGVPGIRQHSQELVDQAVEKAKESSVVCPGDYLTVMRDVPRRGDRRDTGAPRAQGRLADRGPGVPAVGRVGGQGFRLALPDERPAGVARRIRRAGGHLAHASGGPDLRLVPAPPTAGRRLTVLTVGHLPRAAAGRPGEVVRYYHVFRAGSSLDELRPPGPTERRTCSRSRPRARTPIRIRYRQRDSIAAQSWSQAASPTTFSASSLPPQTRLPKICLGN